MTSIATGVAVLGLAEMQAADDRKAGMQKGQTKYSS